MKILIYSPCFYPSIGGIETVVSLLAHEFAHFGHEVILICHIPLKKASKPFPFTVFRQPSPFKFLQLVNWCDVFFQANVSLKGLWPLLLIRRPWVVSHNGWYCRTDFSMGWQDWLKKFASRFAVNISVSQAVADHMPTQSAVIHNPYQSHIFYEKSGILRTKDLIFVGRLVTDKGADLLLDALAQLISQGLTAHLTIVGSGPEAENLFQQTAQLNLTPYVDFLGVKTGEELASLLNAHKILVIPSRCQEGFGIVALEGIACGCFVVTSESGGLQEAIGSCGITFPQGDQQSLVTSLFDLLTTPAPLMFNREVAEAHLRKHHPAAVTQAYLDIIEEAKS